MADGSSQIILSQKADQLISTGKKLIEAFGGSVTKEITDAMAAVSGVAEKGTIVFLQSFGAALIIFCMALKIKIGDHSLGTLTRSEYIVTVVVALVFILAGTTMRFYILKCALDTQKAISETGREIIEKQAAAAISQIERITEVGKIIVNQPITLPTST